MTKILLLNKFQRLINKNSKQTKASNTFALGRKVSLMAKLFGCWHGNMGRPFTNDETAYRSCLNCGARRQFNPETMETHGNFYFPPVVKAETINKI
jgi:hypothetical protein